MAFARKIANITLSLKVGQCDQAKATKKGLRKNVDKCDLAVAVPCKLRISKMLGKRQRIAVLACADAAQHPNSAI